MGVTRQDILNARLREYLRAEERVLRGEEYEVAGRKLRLPDLDDIHKAIDNLIAQGAMVEGEPPKPDRIRRVVFQDW